METKKAHVVITGANRGIGRAVAKRLAEDQAHLFLAIRKTDSELVKELTEAGASSVEIFETDLSTREGVERLAEKFKDIRVDILFNNAGLLTGGVLEEQPLDDIYNLVQVNITALIHLSRAVLPQMLKRKKGLIINHSSVTAVMQFPGATVYAASKAAVLAFTNCLKQELKGTGVQTLTLITPGIKTRMYDEIDKLYGKNFDLSVMNSPLPSKKYADMIREAILENVDTLSPSGMQGAALKLARYLPAAFEKAVSFKFKR